MGKLVKMTGLVVAEAVFVEMKEMFEREQNPSYILTYGFANNKCTGYHFSSNERGVTVINNPVSDQIRLVYGTRDQFDANTNVCKDDTAFVDIHPDHVAQAAALTLGYLLYGQPPRLF